MIEKWYLTVGSEIISEFKNKQLGLKFVNCRSFTPFREIDKDHYIMGNMNLVPKSKLRYCN